MSSSFFGQKTREQVIQIIGQEPGIRAIQILLKIKKGRMKMSYQNVHKILQSLERERVIHNSNSHYYLSSKWLKKLKKFVGLVSATA